MQTMVETTADRKLPADAAGKPTEEVEQQLVVFTLNDEEYGVDVGAVREIIRLQEVTQVPRAPPSSWKE